MEKRNCQYISPVITPYSETLLLTKVGKGGVIDRACNQET